MRTFDRIVVDTNVFVSGVVLIGSPPRNVVNRAVADGVVLFSEDTMRELAEVLFRPKFDRYIGRKEREEFLNLLVAVAELIPIVQVVRECRDPKDDKFLEVALNGRADVIITGDGDQLAMNPWRGIAIVSPKDYLIVEV